MADVVKALARDAPVSGRWAMPARSHAVTATAECQGNGGGTASRAEGAASPTGSATPSEGGSFRGSGRGGGRSGNSGRSGGVGAGRGSEGAAENGANARLNGWEGAGLVENGVSISPLANK